MLGSTTVALHVAEASSMFACKYLLLLVFRTMQGKQISENFFCDDGIYLWLVIKH